MLIIRIFMQIYNNGPDQNKRALLIVVFLSNYVSVFSRNYIWQ